MHNIYIRQYYTSNITFLSPLRGRVLFLASKYVSKQVRVVPSINRPTRVNPSVFWRLKKEPCYGGHLLQQWLQEWPHRVISFYNTGHSRWKEVSSTKLQFKDRENPTWRWILDVVGCYFALLRRVCWPALEECYECRVCAHQMLEAKWFNIYF
jgi:hypothetical protein